MEFLDWWIVLLPAVFIVGWAAGRVDMNYIVSQVKQSPKQVFQAFSDLLGGRRREAAYRLQEVGALTIETAELYFAAAQLHRELGELESAISIHKQLLELKDFEAEQLARARYELGLDYFKGGFFDLAEKCFQAVASSSYSANSLEKLFTIHFRMRAWQQALDDYQRLSNDSSNPEIYRPVIAHLYCEWSAECLPTDPECLALIDKALAMNPLCIRARLIKGDLLLVAKEYQAALDQWQPLLGSDNWLFLLPSRILKAYQLIDKRQQGLQLLVKLLYDHPSNLLFSKIFALLNEEQDIELTEEIAQWALSNIGGTVAARAWLGVARRRGQANLAAVENSLPVAEKDLICNNCGYRSSEHIWQCPLCSKWETIEPIVQ